MGIVEEVAKLQRQDLTGVQRYRILGSIMEACNESQSLLQEKFEAPLEWMVGAESGLFLERLRFSDDEAFRWFDQLLQSISIYYRAFPFGNEGSAAEPYM